MVTAAPSIASSSYLTKSQHDSTAKHRLTGIVRQLHPKSGPNWSRAKLELADTNDTCWVTAKFAVEVGDIITADCLFNPKFHSYDVVELIAPDDGKVSNQVVTLKLAEYLDGVGKVKAQRLSEKFPGDLFDKVVTSPQEVADACGADVRDVVAVGEQLRVEQTALGKMSKLLAMGYPNYLAKRICRADSLYQVASKSPYKAIQLVEGLGWLIADEVGRKMGIKVDDPARIEAGIEHYYAEQVTRNGHTRVTERELLSPAALPSLLGVGWKVIEGKVREVLVPVGDGWVVRGKDRENAETIRGFFVSET